MKMKELKITKLNLITSEGFEIKLWNEDKEDVTFAMNVHLLQLVIKRLTKELKLKESQSSDNNQEDKMKELKAQLSTAKKEVKRLEKEIAALQKSAAKAKEQAAKAKAKAKKASSKKSPKKKEA